MQQLEKIYNLVDQLARGAEIGLGIGARGVVCGMACGGIVRAKSWKKWDRKRASIPALGNVPSDYCHN